MISLGSKDVTRVYLGARPVQQIYLGDKLVWSGEEPRALKFVGRALDNALSVQAYGPALDLEYSTNGRTWSTFTAGSTVVSFGRGKAVYLRAGPSGNTSMASNPNNANSIVLSGEVVASGPLGALLSADQDPDQFPDYCFDYLFGNRVGHNTPWGLVDASKILIPEGVVNKQYSLANLFQGCTALTAAPELPSGEGSLRTFDNAFKDCKSLSSAPTIPGASWGQVSHSGMFRYCSALSSITVELTGWQGNGSGNWVDGVAADGVFFCKEQLGTDETIQRSGDRCPANWIVGNYDFDAEAAREMSSCITRYSQTTAFLYDGQPHTLDAESIKVYNRKTAAQLVLGVDYGIGAPEGQDDISPGDKEVILSGNDPFHGYFGNKVLSYKIASNNITACQITAGVAFDGGVPPLTVYQPDLQQYLVQGVDFSMTYEVTGDVCNISLAGLSSYTGVTSLTAQTATSDPGLLFTKHDPDEQADVQISLRRNNSSVSDPGLQVKRGSGNWEDMVYSTVYSDASAVYVRSKSTGKMSVNRNNYNYLQVHGASVDLSGNICSLLDRTGVYNRATEGNAFPGLFKNQSKIVDASKAVISGGFSNDSCFGMFANCTDLTAAPQCYITHRGGQSICETMFKDCVNLKTPPPTLVAGSAGYLWKQMFMNCVSLTSIPDVPGMDRPTTYQCQEMFSGCSSLTDVDLPFERINDGSYSCASMFTNCSQLSSMAVKFTSWNGNATDNWLNGVAATGTFYCPSALGTNETIERGVSRCPVGWTVVNPS